MAYEFEDVPHQELAGRHKGAMETLQRLQVKHDALLQAQADTLNCHADYLEKLKADHDLIHRTALAEMREAMAKTEAACEARLAAMRDEHRTYVDETEKYKAESQTALTKLKSEHAEALKAITDKFDMVLRSMQAMKAAHDAEIAALNAQHAAALKG